MKNDHLTFHLGDDNAGKRVDLLEYIEHNWCEASQILESIESSDVLSRRFNAGKRRFPANVTAMRMDARILRDPKGKIHRLVAARPIMLHSLFRTGSTFVWARLRESKDHRAYYEPLHEDLSYLSVNRLPEFRRSHTLRTRHELDGPWLFAEYEEFLIPGRVGIPYYRRAFAYESYADNSAQPALRRYVDMLVNAAADKQAVLQFNRSALRQRWFHREYPHAHHFYLVRNPRDQWASYIRFAKNGKKGFARTDAVICGMNKARALIRPLQDLVPLVYFSSRGDFFSRYDRLCELYSWEQLYVMFFYLWLQGLLEAAATGSIIVDMDRVASLEGARKWFEGMLAVRGAMVDLAGLRMTGYPEDALPLTSEQCWEIECEVLELVRRSYGQARLWSLEGVAPELWKRVCTGEWRESGRQGVVLA